MYVNPFILLLSGVEYESIKTNLNLNDKITQVYRLARQTIEAMENLNLATTTKERKENLIKQKNLRVNEIEDSILQRIINDMFSPLLSLFYQKEVSVIEMKLGFLLQLLNIFRIGNIRELILEYKYFNNHKLEIGADNDEDEDDDEDECSGRKISFKQVIEIASKQKMMSETHYYRFVKFDISSAEWTSKNDIKAFCIHVPLFTTLTTNDWIQLATLHTFHQYIHQRYLSIPCFILTKKMIQNKNFHTNSPSYDQITRLLCDATLITNEEKNDLSIISEFINKVDGPIVKKQLSLNLLNNTGNTSLWNIIKQNINDYEGVVYSLRYYDDLFDEFKNFINESVGPNMDIDIDSQKPYIIKTIKDKEEPKPKRFANLTEEQWHGVSECISKNVTCISGAGGTGKSTLLEAVIIYFMTLNYLIPRKEKIDKKTNEVTFHPTILATAFKNETVSQLQQRLEKYDDFYKKRILFKTMHSTIYTTSMDYDEIRVIIIDEASMVDIELWHHFKTKFNNLKHIIFVGDFYQLGPIKHLNIFKWLCEKLGYINLTKNQRSENEQLSNFLDCVRNISIVSSQNEKNIYKQKVIDTIFFNQIPQIEYHNNSYLHCQAKSKDSRDAEFFIFKTVLTPILSKIDVTKKNYVNVMWVCPFNIGMRYIERVVNDYYFFETYAPKIKNYSSFFCVGMRVMFKKTDKDRYIYKGAEGYIEAIPTSNHKYFSIRLNDSLFDDVTIDEIECASCISVHKSQGKGADTVVVVLPNHFQKWYNSMLYTALSRTRKHLIIVGDIAYIEQMLMAPNPTELSILNYS
jgi:hypothetical protein